MAIRERQSLFLCIVLAAGLLIFFSPEDGLAKARKILTTASQAKPPSWLNLVPEADKSYFYFVGRSSGARSPEDAENEAAFDAVRQVVAMIGVDASFSYERLRRTADLLLIDRLAISGGSQVIGIKRLAAYFEKQILTEGDTMKTSYNAHLLVRYPREELQAEITRLEQESTGRVKIAEKLLAEGFRLEADNLPEEAFAKVSEALRLIDGSSIHASGETLNRLAGLKNPVFTAMRRLGLKLHRVVVEPVAVNKKTDNSPVKDSVLTAELARALSNHGFQPEKISENSRAGILPRVVTSCREEDGSVLGDGFCLSRWTAAIALIDPQDDSIFFTETYSAKGFGPDMQRAGFDAQRKLRIEIFARFARSASDRFNSKVKDGG
jgi:hypothetical protein